MASTNEKKEKSRLLKRQHIVASAELILLQEGLSGLSMDAVAKKAKIAKGTLYIYFKSKEEIIAQLTVKARESLLERFRIETEKCSDPLDQIRAVMWSNFYYYREKRLYNDLVAFYEGNRHLEETAELKASGQQIQSFVVSLLEQARAKGFIKPTLDISSFSLIMWGMSVGIVQLIDTKSALLQEYTGKTDEPFFKAYVELIIDGIKV